MNIAIEVVVFKAKAGVSDGQLQTAALAVTPILKEMPGLISREFGASGDGKYIEPSSTLSRAASWRRLEQC